MLFTNLSNMPDQFSKYWPPQDERIQQALLSVYQDGDWGRYHGKRTEQLAEQLAERFAMPHVHLVCSGTVGIELALRGLGVTSGDEVILAGYDFPGNFRCIEAVGARPVLADVEVASWSLSVNSFEQAISASTKAVIVSSLHGGLADVTRITAIARQHGIGVVEDICQIPGAKVSGKIAGSLGDVSVLSFGGSKLLSAGRGGAVLAKNEAIWQRIHVFKERGNDTYALSQLQAAVLLPQLEKLDERNAIRTTSALQIIAATEGIAQLQSLAHESGDHPVFYKIAWAMPSCQQRAALLTRAQELELPLFEGFRGFVKRSDRRCSKPVDLSHSTRATETTVLLHHPALLAAPGEVESLGQQVKDLFEEYC